MATIDKRKVKSGFVYRVRFRHLDYPCFSMTFLTFTDALKWIEKNESPFKEDPNKYFTWKQTIHSRIHDWKSCPK